MLLMIEWTGLDQILEHDPIQKQIALRLFLLEAQLVQLVFHKEQVCTCG